MKNLSIFYGTFRAFSLVEMLMALLVASLLLAALAPVMTRKFGENVNVSGVGAAPKAPADIQCYSYNDAQPEVTVSVNDVYTASFVIASGGGGGAGATSETVKTWDETEKLEGVINGTGTGSRETKDIPITENMDKIVISHLIGGGGGGGYGNSDKTEEEKSFIPSPEVCKSYGTEKTDTVGNTGEDLATYDSANKLCVTKYNQKTTSSGNIFCSNNYDHSCNDNEGTYNGYAYSGCKRWICNHDGAVAACNVLKASTKDDTSSSAAARASPWASVRPWASRGPWPSASAWCGPSARCPPAS